jgi:imidazole glycerol-phosphate synthase subunit HisH
MIAVIDYQMGNLRSVQKAFEKVGFEALITDDPRAIASAEKVVLPGVGAFRDAIAEIKRRDLVNPIKDYIASGKPFLGICLGLQLLFDVSYEEGVYEGLGVFKGEVKKFEIPVEFKVPHMGWNTVRKCTATLQDGQANIEAVNEGDYFYFVHSYYVVPHDPGLVALESEHGVKFCAAISQGNLLATQFHPEKSQANGLRLLKQFAAQSSLSNL